MLFNSVLKDKAGLSLLSAILIGSVLVVLSNLLLPHDSALYVGSNTVTLLGKYLCYALLAVALDLVWGYLGILSLGHGAFFCARRLRDGYVSDASDRHPRCVWRSGFA